MFTIFVREFKAFSLYVSIYTLKCIVISNFKFKSAFPLCTSIDSVLNVSKAFQYLSLVCREIENHLLINEAIAHKLLLLFHLLLCENKPNSRKKKVNLICVHMQLIHV